MRVDNNTNLAKSILQRFATFQKIRRGDALYLPYCEWVKTRHKHINVVTMGCSKNLVDSEVLMKQLQSSGHEVEHDAYHSGTSEVVIVNTCGFIDAAKEESIQSILEFTEEKKKGHLDKLIVTGCLSERYKDQLKVELPEVDAFFGTNDMQEILHYLNSPYRADLLGERLMSTPDHYAYLKISEGCDRKCSFCAIPLMRGKHRSKPIEHVVQEARALAARGVKELILIAQELTYYGVDLYRKRMLSDLLHRLADVEGIAWIRLHYAYPTRFPTEVFDVMRERTEVCNYLDIPLQHASDPMLQAMKRQTTVREMKALIHKARKVIPDITLRTTMMVGFPGETDDHFNEMLDFVNEIKFDRLGVFQYSHEEGTSAFTLPDDVPTEVKRERASELMDAQREISYALNVAKIGSRKKVLIDRIEGENWIGRTEADSPEVDNEVIVKVENRMKAPKLGDFMQVEVVNAEEYHLFARIIDGED